MGLEGYRRSVSETKRASILKAGRLHFLSKGYNGAAIADIAREADVSTATLYKHFTSKEELFAAVINGAYPDDEYLATAQQTDLEEFMVGLLQHYLRAHFEGQVNTLLRIVIAEVPSAPQLAQDMFERFITLRYRQLEQLADHLVAQGKLKPHDTHYGVRLIGGVLKEYFIWPALFDAGMTLPKDAGKVVRRAVGDYLELYGVQDRPVSRRKKIGSG